MRREWISVLEEPAWRAALFVLPFVRCAHAEMVGDTDRSDEFGLLCNSEVGSPAARIVRS